MLTTSFFKATPVNTNTDDKCFNRTQTNKYKKKEQRQSIVFHLHRTTNPNYAQVKQNKKILTSLGNGARGDRKSSNSTSTATMHMRTPEKKKNNKKINFGFIKLILVVTCTCAQTQTNEKNNNKYPTGKKNANQ